MPKKPAGGTFAARLRALRESRGLGLRELARKAGITHQALAKIESGSEPGFSTVQRIADALGVRTDDLR